MICDYIFENDLSLSHLLEANKDVHKLFVSYQTYVDMGNSSGIFQAGSCYQDGFMVEKGESKAIIYFQKSLKICYIFRTNIGSKLKKTSNKAFIYFQKSTRMGSGQYIKLAIAIKIELGLKKMNVFFYKAFAKRQRLFSSCLFI